MSYYVLDNRVTCIHVYAKETIPPKKKQEKGEKDFIYTNDESE